MATVTPAAVHAQNLGEYQRRVRSPLSRLHGVICLYVGIEAALLLVLLAAVCFWLSLTFDYGLFKLSGFDWVQQSWSWWLRLVLLILAVGGVLAIVTLTVLGRLLREFSDPALALVLERRFPDQLGDRLITAVELSDLRRAAAQGYSPAMVLETIHEAAERVQQVPVAQAFNWRRLIWRGVLAVVLTLGLYALLGGLFWTLDAIGAVRDGRIGYSRFNEVVQMWFERNVLLRHTLWPRRAQLVFVNVPEEGMAAGIGGPAPQVHVRALEYVIAEPDSYDGWRALTWDDLRQRRGLAGGDVPNIRLKGQEKWNDVSVDDVALMLGKWKEAKEGEAAGPAPKGWEIALEAPDQADKPEARELMVGDRAALQNVLDRVNDSIKRPEMSRTMRRLMAPEGIYLSSSGCKNPPQSRLKIGDDHGYTYEFKDLQFDSNDQRVLKFSMSAADYTTPTRTLTMVDPPDLEGARLVQTRPAYLYYPPRSMDKPEDSVTLDYLHGRKQLFQVQTILTKGNDTARIEAPAGTDFVLTAAADNDLKEAFLVVTPTKTEVTSIRLHIDPSKRKGGEQTSSFFVGRDAADHERWVSMPVSLKPAGVPGDADVATLQTTKEDEKEKGALAKGEPLRVPLEIGLKDRKKRVFEIVLPDVRKSASFTLEYTDEQNVTGRKHVDIQIQPDAAPVIQDVSIVGLRSRGDNTAEGEKKLVYLVTPRARVPVAARISDDHCLGEVVYHVNVKPVPPPPPADAPKPAKPAPEPPGRDIAYSPPAFLDLVSAAQDGLPRLTVQDLLVQPQQLPYRQALLKRDATIRTDTINVGYFPSKEKRPLWRDAQDPANKLSWDFPLWQYNLELGDDHPQYLLRFMVEAVDTDADDSVVDGKPQPHRSKSETYTFLVVRDSYLVGLIGQDEAKQYKELNAQFQGLAGLTTDFDVFKSEAEAFEKRLKDGGDPQSAEQVADLLVEVSGKLDKAHQLSDPETFLLSSEGHKNLKARILADSNEDKDLQKTLESDPPPANADALRRVMQQHEEYRNSVARLDALLYGMREEKSTLHQMLETLGAANAAVTELQKQDVQLDRISKSVNGAVDTTQKAVDAYERLVREEQLNVLDKDVIDYTQKRVVDKMHEIQRLDFPAATEAVARFHKALTEKAAGQTDLERIEHSREVGQDVQEPMTRLVADLHAVLDAISGGKNRQSLRQTLVNIDKGVQDEKRYAEDVERILQDEIFKP
ncbi:MAG TPA: hypothetical protein VMS17_02380 [Gemmataceae bacterium]|nr:hypothetical protein [Gemmataceae bacterium]